MASGAAWMLVVVLRGCIGALACIAHPWLLGEAQYVALEPAHDKTAASFALPLAHAGTVRRGRSFWQLPLEISSVLFCLALEECGMMCVFVLLEHLYGDKGFITANWHFSLPLVVLFIILILPFAACLLLCVGERGKRWSTSRTMASVALFVGWCFAFFRIPVPSTVQPAITGLYGAVLSRAGVLGISMIAVLSGTAAAGAMCDSYEMLSLRRKKKWREMDVDGAEASFVRTCTDLQARRASARMLEADIEADGPRTGISRYFTRSSKDKELAALHTEITGLAMMASVMRSDLDVMQAQQRRIRYSRTVFGRILLACGYLFSLYCAFRIVQCLLNLVFFGYNTGASPDFVSTCFAYAVRMFGMDIDVHTWAPRIAFLFLGGLICMRMRVILSSLSSMINALSSGTSTDLLVLFTAQVLCIYTLAALIQLHTNVATEPGTPHRTSKLLASLPEFQRVFGGMFDFVFLLTASATAGYRWYCWRSDVAAL